MLIGGSGWSTVFCCFLRPLHDSLATENDCSGLMERANCFGE